MPWLRHAEKLVSREDAGGLFASMRFGDIHCTPPAAFQFLEGSPQEPLPSSGYARHARGAEERRLPHFTLLVGPKSKFKWCAVAL